MNTLDQSLQRVYGLQEGGSVTQDMMMRPGMQMPPQDMMQRGAVSEQEIDMMVDDVSKDMNDEEKQILESMLERGLAIQESPLAAEVAQLKQYGEGGDTELAHLRPGEMVIPPEFLEDAQFESALAKKFDEFDINPEQAIVGSGIASLNPVTGLEQFFFKKIGKALKKVVKKIAPIAGPLANFIPGVGPVLAGAIGAGANVAAGKGLKGALSGALGGYGAGKLMSGIGSLGKVGGKLVGQGNFSSLGGLDKFRALGSGLKSGNLASTFFNPATGDKGIFGGKLGPSIRKGLGSLTGLGQPQAPAMTEAEFNKLSSVDQQLYLQNLQNQPSTGPFGGQIGPNLRDTFLGTSEDPGLLRNVFGGGEGGGFGDALKMGGIGALAAGLGKLAYEDAKKQTGVPLTPLTTMSPTGRYNIEAEISRRMGQQAPNPVEFGLLPEGTLPELSGGKPAGMQEGGEVQNKMRALGMRAEQANATIEELESTFNPNNMRDLVASNLPFDPTAIENLLMSEEKKLYDRAKLDFSTAILRNETGAVINDSELDWIDKTYFPQLGDDESVTTLKRQARQKAINSLMPAQKTKSKGIGSMPMMMYGGAVEDLTGGMARGMMYGGPVMAYAEGGAVQMQEGGEMDPSMFPKMDGDINGPGTETSDDIPAMLSDGEFVMTGRAVRGAGSYEMKSEPGGIISLVPSLEEDRERGMDLMYKMMDTFASQAKVS